MKIQFYPRGLIEEYKAGKINRQQFCQQWAELQGFNNTIKGGNDHAQTYIIYREYKVPVKNGVFRWRDLWDNEHTAHSLKEVKIKIDTMFLHWSNGIQRIKELQTAGSIAKLNHNISQYLDFNYMADKLWEGLLGSYSTNRDARVGSYKASQKYY